MSPASSRLVCALAAGVILTGYFDSLPILADTTGGRTVMNTSSPEEQVASILDESRAYYLLTVESTLGDRRVERLVRFEIR